MVDPATVSRFLGKLFEFSDDGVVSLLGIGEKGTPQEGVYKKRVFTSQDQGSVIVDHVARWADMGVAAFFVPAAIKPAAVIAGDVKEDKIAAFTSIVLDIDSGDVPAKARYAAAALGTPSMIVMSGGKTDTGNTKKHLYWLLDEPTEKVARVGKLRKLLAAKVGGDQSFGRVTQVIRIAGSVHCKNGVASPVKLDHCSDATYSLEDLAEAIEAMQPMPGIEPVQNLHTLPAVAGMMDFSPRQDTAQAALNRDVHAGGDKLTRFSEFSKGAGLKISEARAGREGMTLDRALQDMHGWNAMHNIDRWPDERIETEFRGLLKKDVATRGPMPRARDAWPDPAPLQDELPSVQAFDEALLPEGLRAWVADIARRMSLPLDMVAIPAMIAAGSVIGRQVGVRPQANTDWTEVANLWGCVVARPGFLKSPAASEAMKPLRRLEAKAAEEFKEAMTAHMHAEELHKIEKETAAGAAKKAMKDGGRDAAIAMLSGVDIPAPPVERRHLTSDATAEKLGEICAANPKGVMVHRDEMVSLFADLDREEKAAARGFFLSAWGGQEGYTFDRIARGTIRIPAVNVSLFGTTQPTRLASYIRDSIRRHDDGMVQRLQLLAWPDFKGEYVEADRAPDSEARNKANECFDYLAHIDTQEIRAEVDDYDDPHAVPFLRFDSDALEAFRSWRDGLEKRVRGDEMPAALCSHLSKFRGLIPRLALICHLAGAAEGPIGIRALRQALGWATYLESHARRAYASVGTANAEAARSIWKRVEHGELPSPFTARDIQRKGWAGLADKEPVKAGLDALEQAGWITGEKTETGGRPAIHYRPNPKRSKVPELPKPLTDETDRTLAAPLVSVLSVSSPSVSGTYHPAALEI